MKNKIPKSKKHLKQLLQEVMDDVAFACGAIGDSYQYGESDNHFIISEDYWNHLLEKFGYKKEDR